MAEASVATLIKSRSSSATGSYRKLPEVRVWAGCFRIPLVTPYSKELKTGVHTDLQNQNYNFTWSKEIVHIKERYTVKIGSCDDT